MLSTVADSLSIIRDFAATCLIAVCEEMLGGLPVVEAFFGLPALKGAVHLKELYKPDTDRYEQPIDVHLHLLGCTLFCSLLRAW